MDSREILRYCLERGLLIDESVLKILSESTDVETAKAIIGKITEQTQKKVLTRDVFENNSEVVSEFLVNLPRENRQRLEKLKVKMGLRIEISKEITASSSRDVENYFESKPVRVLSKNFVAGKKYEVKDFTAHYKNRFVFLRNLLQQRSELKNLVSINKISGNGQRFSIIGMVSDKRITQNKNVLLEVEDLTGKTRVLINSNKEEVYKKALDISLDTVLGFIGSGNREIMFANDVILPDARLPERKRSPVEEYALFLGDIQAGSKIFMEKNFLKFLDYLNGKYGNDPRIDKIKYIFLVGDVVEGVGIFPKQEKELIVPDLEAQYARLASMLSKIKRDITIIMSPGNHDGVRLMEPQPPYDEKYAWPVYNLKNVILTGNPALVNIGAKKGFEGINVLTYHGFSYPFYADNVNSFIEQGDAMNHPTIIMKYLLKNRHLAPTNKSTQFAPSEEDGMLIETVPDVMVSGHTHKMDIDSYNNILLISTATWEELNKFQERMGNKPDFCKIPMLNLKTGKVDILDFENIEGENEQKKLEVNN